jgi:cytosine/adenosine deaminase-related metal-dependent hydrolase
VPTEFRKEGLSMRKLVSVQRLLEEAERDGSDSAYLMVDPDDVCSVDPDELDEIDDLAENPSDEEE